MKLFVKNMVCNRCKMAVQTELEKLGLHPLNIQLGEIDVQEEHLSATQVNDLVTSLTSIGFELIDNRKGRIIEKIKTIIIDLVHHKDKPSPEKYSELITRELHYDYPYLSKLFSEVEGQTIEQYIINQKVEKIKEYIVYDELNLSEIADRMGYSSVSHLSSQFKKATGLPPSHFKNIGTNHRKPLDQIGRS